MGAAFRSAGIVVLLLIVVAWPTAAGAQRGADRYRALLAPHGSWVSAAPHGDVFVPREAHDDGFAPYLSGGRWSATERGLVFESTYAWGAVCFHHGRWVRPAGLDTWAWVPDDAWSSAWVEWRRRGSDVAWRPLAPARAASGASTWYVAGLGSLGAADLATRALRVGDDTVAGFAAIAEMSLDGGAAPTSVPRGQVMLSGGGRIVVHERGRDRVLEVAPVVVPRGSAEEREARRREELARAREVERAREREAAAARVAAAPPAAATASATVVVAPSPPAPSPPTPWTLGFGYVPFGFGFGAPGGAAAPAAAVSGAGASGTAASGTTASGSYAPPRFSAPRLPFGGWRE